MNGRWISSTAARSPSGASEILGFYPAFPAAMRHLATSGHGTSSLQEYLFDKLSAFGYRASWVFGV
jgi:hypothetical protein